VLATFGLLALSSGQFNQTIGKLIKEGEINKAQQLIAHSLVGCVSASIGGGDCGGAAIGSALGEAVADLAHNGLGLSQDRAATIGRYAALASALATADEAIDVTYTNLAASNAISNNFLLPDEKQKLVDELKACNDNAQCKESVTKPYQSISSVRDLEFKRAYDACEADTNNCATFHAYHYDIRSGLTKKGNEYYQNNKDEFVLLPDEKAIFHTYVQNEKGEVVNTWTKGLDYKKYIHPILGYEVVLNSKGDIITDPLNGGTYNYYNPTTKGVDSLLIADDDLHEIFDVDPYFEIGNAINDPTTKSDRLGRIIYWLSAGE